jgi:NADH:ubiquinone oxidoreductase subunit 5 (subunit L)/multisubunit Na+/H+ antiporter MnhA subunit
MAGTPTIAQLAQWCAIVVVLAPFVGAASALFAVRAFSHLRARIPAALAVVSAVLAIAVVAHVLAAGTVRLDPRGLFAVDVLAALMLVLVAGLSAIIQSFSLRYLRGDPRQVWFVVTANLLVGVTGLMVTAQTVIGFAAAWMLAGASLVALLGTYPSLHQARDGMRRTALSFAIGDGALVVAVLVLCLGAGGDIRFDRLAEAVAHLTPAGQVATGLLLGIAAFARSTQLPFHRWLPATLAAPTPVSALMHAGVVNAAAVLVIRFIPLFQPSVIVMATVFGIGVATLVFAAVVRVVKPDVKGRLVYSTIAQMGFMVMALGLGAFGAAVFHLIAHGLFKATLFLSAGSAVSTNATRRDAPAPVVRPARERAVAFVAAALVPAATIVVAWRLLYAAATPASLALLLFVAVTGSVALGAVLVRRTGAWVTLASILVTVLLAFAYVAAINATSTALSGVVGHSGSPVPPWLIVIPLVALLALEALRARPQLVPALQRRLYAAALDASTPSASPQHAPASLTRTGRFS